MKKLFTIVFSLIGYVGFSYAQEKTEKFGLVDRPIEVVALDTVPTAKIDSRWGTMREIPNVYQDRKLANKDISIRLPMKKLTGQQNIMMPGTEKLEETIEKDAVLKDQLETDSVFKKK